MTVEADIYTALQALVGGRCLFDGADEKTAAPYIVVQQVGGESPTFLEAAVPSKKNGRFQVTTWAKTRNQASAIALQAEAAMTLATAFQAKPIGAAIADKDEDTHLHGSIQDYSVWSDR